MVAARNLGFSNSNFLTAKAVKGPILYQHAKFFEDRSTFHRDIAFFSIFQYGGRGHLYFQKFVILTISLLYGANACHRDKFRQNRSNGCGDIAI